MPKYARSQKNVSLWLFTQIWKSGILIDFYSRVTLAPLHHFVQVVCVGYNGDPKSGHVQISNGQSWSGFWMVSRFQMENLPWPFYVK